MEGGREGGEGGGGGGGGGGKGGGGGGDGRVLRLETKLLPPEFHNLRLNQLLSACEGTGEWCSSFPEAEGDAYTALSEEKKKRQMRAKDDVVCVRRI